LELSTIKSGLSLRGVFGEQVLEELMWLLALTARSFKEAAQDAVVFQALGGAGALNDFAHDDRRAQTPLGLVIGGGDAGAPETSKEMFLLGAQ